MDLTNPMGGLIVALEDMDDALAEASGAMVQVTQKIAGLDFGTEFWADDHTVQELMLQKGSIEQALADKAEERIARLQLIAGDLGFDLIGTIKDGQNVYLLDLWTEPSPNDHPEAELGTEVPHPVNQFLSEDLLEYTEASWTQYLGLVLETNV